jgi:RNA polymerase sigma-70 factor (ECF subfamily)
VTAVQAAVTSAARGEAARVLALLARRYGDVDLAEEAVQDALLHAWRTWPRDGVPANPTGWLLVAARRAAVDRLRHEASQQRRAVGAAVDPTVAGGDAARADRGDVWTAVEEAPDERLLDPGTEIPDERLRLILLCCHPALDRDAQVALTVRLVLGLTTAEIAAGFLVPEATLAQRLVRAKKKIRGARIPLSLPPDLSDRLDAVLTIVYLVFTEGHFSAGGGGLVRVDLAAEAVRLVRLVDELAPNRADVLGLRALMTYHHARRDTRVDGAGDLVLLDDQDRTRWHANEIAEADVLLHRAMRGAPPNRYSLLAVVAGLHAHARSSADTDWSTVCRAYETLERLDPSPVVGLNHAVALAMRDGPAVGLAVLDHIQGLDRYHAFHVARGHLLRRSGDEAAASEAFRRARTMAVNEAQSRYLDTLLTVSTEHPTVR